MRCATLIASFMLACSANLPAAYAETIAFDRDVVGIPPSDFDSWGTGEAGPGRWAVVFDDSVPGGHAFEQYRREPAQERAALAIYKPFSGDNVEVTIRFKAISGGLDQSAGIAVRLTTPNDYYVARASAIAKDVRLYRVVKGKFDELARAHAPITSRKWHALSVRAEGHRLLVALDGQPLLGATDTTFALPGKVALWTKADSVTRFDQLDIRPLH